MGMDSSSAQLHHHQEMGSETLESILVSTKSNQEKKPKPSDEQSPKCPRCDSTNTKFCYYNNYSLSQPRYFCKSCRRYWTKGGTLRNVPVGGGCRKTKRPSSSSPSVSSKRSTAQDHPFHPSPNVPNYYNDISQAISRLQTVQTNGQFGLDDIEFSMSLNPNMPLSDGLFGFGDNTQRGLENVYYGVGNGGMGRAFEEMSTSVKQEMWGLPWEGVDGQNGHVAESDSSGLNWNLIGSSNWHGLLNGSLM